MSCGTHHGDKAKTADTRHDQAEHDCCRSAREERLDEALDQTFPASDPVSAEIPAPKRQARKESCCGS